MPAADARDDHRLLEDQQTPDADEVPVADCRKGRSGRFDFRYWDQNDDLPFSEVVADIAEHLDKRTHKPVLKMIGLDER